MCNSPRSAARMAGTISSPGRRVTAQNRPGSGNTAHAGHDDIRDDDVRGQPLSFADERLPVADGANDLELWLEQPAPAPERRRVIVSEQHSHATHRPSSRRFAQG